MEKFKLIQGFPNYQIGNQGTVISVKPMVEGVVNYHTMKQYKDKAGFNCISLYSGSQYASYRVHNLVLKHYVAKYKPNAKYKFKDGDKTNICVGNLVRG